MAPVLSKPPPRSEKDAIERAVARWRPALDSLCELLAVLDNSCRGLAKEVPKRLEWFKDEVDRACAGCIRFLENFLCLDLQRYARGPAKGAPPLQGSLPILFVLMLLVMLYNAFVFGYMPAMDIPLNSRTSLMFHAWIFLVLGSFAQAVQTDPGTIPAGNAWRTKGNPPSEARERKRGCDEPRWCRKSEAYKPDRAHYCRVLRRCVLRMDHHCPWLGNTIGFHNHKYFFLFLLYTNLACGQLGVGILDLLVHYSLPALTTFLLVGAEGITLLLGTILVPFFIFHFWLLARNMTTIEFCEQMRSRDDPEEEDVMERRDYDVGFCRNFAAVLGPNPLLWLLPLGGPSGNGISFPAAAPRHAIEAPSRSSKAKRGTKDLERGRADPEESHPVAENDHDIASKDAAGSTSRRPSRPDQEAELQDILEEEEEELEGEEEEEEEEPDEKKGTGSEDEEKEDAVEGASNSDRSRGSEPSSGEDLEAGSQTGSAQEPSDSGFLLWRDAAEFAEDLTIGCQFIAEKTQECPATVLVGLTTSCLGRAWSRARQARQGRWKRDEPLLEEKRRRAKARSPDAKSKMKVLHPAANGGSLFDSDSASTTSGHSEKAASTFTGLTGFLSD